MNKILFFAFISVTSSISTAFEKPEYCSKYYDLIYDLEAGPYNNELLLPVETDPTKKAFQLNLTVKNLIDYSVYAKDSHIISLQDELESDTLVQGIESMITSANQYAGFYEISADQELKENMLKCIKNHEPIRGLVSKLDDDFEKQTIENRERKEEFIISSLENALLIHALQTYIEKFNSEDSVYLTRARACYMNNSLRTGDKSLVSPAGCENYKETNEKLEQRFAKEAQAQVDLLNILIREHHLLVTLENDFNILNWFNSKVVLSQFSNNLLSYVPQSVKDKMVLAVSGSKTQFEIMNSYNKIRSQNRDYIVRLYGSLTEESEVVNSFKRVYIEYVNKVHRAVNYHCENRGKFLHYHQGVINSRARVLTTRTVEKNKPEVEHKKEIIALQANQCRKWRQDPYKSSDEWTGKTTFGITMIATGGIVAFIPGIGTVMSPYLIGAGTVILGQKSFQDFAIARDNIRNEEYAHLNSWTDLRGYINELDRQYDIGAEAIIEGLFIFGGVTKTGRALIGNYGNKAIASERHLLNQSVRSDGTLVQRANRFHNLVNQRYKENPGDLSLTNGFITDKLKDFTKNYDISARIRRGSEGGHTHFDILEIGTLRYGSSKANQGRFQNKSQAEIEELQKDALKEIERIAGEANVHVISRALKIQEGLEAEENLAIAKVYLQKIDKNFFKDGQIEIPEFDDRRLLVTKLTPRGISLRFPKIKYESNLNGGIFVENGFDDIPFSDWAALKAKIKDWDYSFQENFTQSSMQEFFRRSDLSAEINMQAYRFYFLQTAIRMFDTYSTGVKLDKQGNVIKYLGLSDEQNDIALLARSVIQNKSVMPRKGAYDWLYYQASVKEFSDMILGSIGRGVKKSKYSRELISGMSFLGHFTKTRTLIYLLLGGGTVFSVDQLAERSNFVHQVTSSANESLRNAQRIYNRYLDTHGKNAPYPYTSSEKSCAKESRSWSVENICLEAEIKKEFWREILKSRTSDEYDFATDSLTKRRVREYIRKYLKNREYFQDGKVFSVVTDLLEDVGQENEREIIKKQILDTVQQSVELSVLQTNDLLTDLDNLVNEPENEMLIAEIRESISKLDNSEDFLPLFETILTLLQSRFPQAVQAPGYDESVSNFLQGLMTEALKD